MLKLSFLGPPMVEWGGEPAGPFVSVKSLALLCYLVMRVGPHAREHLAGLLWGEMPEHRADANLRMALYNLQKLFPGYLAVTRTTAAFNREQPFWLDVEAFDAGLNASEGQIALLQSAIKLYRGEFLEGVFVEAAPGFEAWLVEQREHLRLSFLQALERLADHYARQRDWAASIEAYRRLLAVDALRESVHRRLMLTLARTGRYVAALVQYETCCRLLREELGIEPAPETTDLYERIKIARSKPRAHNLPLQISPIIGREEELAKIAELLGETACRLITLVGPGGIGKTRLAVHAAAEKSREAAFLEGVFFVPLASVSSPELLAPAIADALQFPFYGPRDPGEQLLSYLHSKEMLLILDNFEHLIEGGAGFLMDILAKTTDVKLLVTSRERLSLRREWLLEIQGLRFPRSESDSSLRVTIVGEDAENYAAMRLFRDRVRRVRADFSLSEAERPAVARICQLVEGMPLGIELAASQARTLSCQRIAEEIERGLGFLASPLRDVPDRHRSMQAVFDHSWRFLSAEERNVFKKLSVFRGGFTRDAAHKVAGASLLVLAALVDKSFLHRNPSGRYEVHELLRQYGEEKLRATPKERGKFQKMHCSYFASLLRHREKDLKRGKQVEVLQELGGEIGNIRTAWDWAVERRRIEYLEEALEGLWAFYELRGWYQEGEELLRSANNGLSEGVEELDKPGVNARFILGAVLARWGWFCWRLGRYGQAKGVLDQSLAALRQAGQGARREVAFSLFQLGAIGWYLGDYLEAKRVLRESLMICGDVGDQFILARSLMGLAFVAHSLGEYAEAKQWQQESLTYFRAAKDHRGISQNLIWSEGRIHLAQGEFREAERLLLEGIARSGELKDKFGSALALSYLGVLAYQKADYSKAKQLHRESAEIFQEIGDQWGVAYALAGLGYATHAVGEREAADYNFRGAIKISMEIGTLPVAMEALVGLATLLHTGKEEEGALELLAFVIHHSASSHETKRKATRLAAEIEAKLPAQVVATAQRRGQASTLKDFVEEILGQSQEQVTATRLSSPP